MNTCQICYHNEATLEMIYIDDEPVFFATGYAPHNHQSFQVCEDCKETEQDIAEDFGAFVAYMEAQS